ncbi:MAG: COX15/CtaA family protein [Candidatus Omnitrophica bacterium]|nr:COX15/CtaA family protein [Candidatus Omnitrophota bacterium]
MAGGLVTSHEAGLSVPDWPKSYGQWMPPMVGNVFWEHGHRMIAGSVGILTLVLTLWIQLKETRVWIKKIMWFGMLAVVLQAVLGGLTVIYLLPPPISISHACLAQTFFCLLVALAFYLSPQGIDVHFNYATGLDSENHRKLYRLFLVNTGIIYAQLILGATVRHTGEAVSFHILGATLVVLHSFLAISRVSKAGQIHPFVFRVSMGLGLVIILQIFLGISALVYTKGLPRGYAPLPAEVLLTSAHQTLGAAILGASLLLTLMLAKGLDKK